jgi:hypothetical protein
MKVGKTFRNYSDLFAEPIDEIYNELLLKAYDLEMNESKGKMGTKTIK